MTGLFDSLSQRFNPGSAPAITPRARVRFEHTQDEDGLTEEVTEHVAPPPPQSPPAPTPPAVDAPAFLPAPTPVDIPPAAPRMDTPARSGPPKTEHPIQHTPQGTPATPPRLAPFSETPPQPSNAQPVPTRPDMPPRQSAPDTSRAEHRDPTTIQRVTDRLTAQETKVVTRIAPPEQPAASHDTAPSRRADADTPVAAVPPNVTVKIGRIEVSKPAPPPPPRTSATPQAHRSAPKTATSTLTKYLGWKS